MRRLRPQLSYANVVATLALFLALGGGAVWAANKVTSKQIGKGAVKTKNLAKNAVKTKQIAKNAVTSAKIKKEAVTAEKLLSGSVTRTQLASGTLAGLQVADFQATSVPGLTTKSYETGGTPIPLTGTTSFTPAAGKSYELLVELKGNPIDADGMEGKNCNTYVVVQSNGAPVGEGYIYSSESATPPYNYGPTGGEVVPLGLQSPGQAQTLTALSFGSEGCGAATTASLRGVVVEFG